MPTNALTLVWTIERRNFGATVWTHHTQSEGFGEEAAIRLIERLAQLQNPTESATGNVASRQAREVASGGAVRCFVAGTQTTFTARPSPLEARQRPYESDEARQKADYKDEARRAAVVQARKA